MKRQAVQEGIVCASVRRSQALSQPEKSLYHQRKKAGVSIYLIMFDSLITAVVKKHVSVHAE